MRRRRCDRGGGHQVAVSQEGAIRAASGSSDAALAVGVPPVCATCTRRHSAGAQLALELRFASPARAEVARVDTYFDFARLRLQTPHSESPSTGLLLVDIHRVEKPHR